MLLLGLESAGTGYSVALWDDRRLVQSSGVVTCQSRADTLIAAIDKLLGDADLGYGRLDGIAVNRGPGTFTGIRAGVAAARGLALAGDIPVLGVTTFEAIAWKAGGVCSPAAPVCVIVDARRGVVFRQDFDAGLTGRAEPEILASDRALEGLAPPCILAGSGVDMLADPERLHGFEVVVGVRADAASVLDVAAQKLAAGEPLAPGFDIEPLYLRPPDARPQAGHVRTRT